MKQTTTVSHIILNVLSGYMIAILFKLGLTKFQI